MNNTDYLSSVRNSTINSLLEKVRKKNYGKYLLKIKLKQIRRFNEAQICFDFPVTALIGTNGSGKSTILNAAACTYVSEPAKFFPKSRVGDKSMDNWIIESEIIDKDKSPTDILRSTLLFKNNNWQRIYLTDRHVKYFTISRTVPPIESPFFALRKKLQTNSKGEIITKKVVNIDSVKLEAERILGKPLSEFELYEVSYISPRRFKKVHAIVDGERIIKKIVEKSNTTLPQRQYLFVGHEGEIEYSEFSFGAGESSILRIVFEIETIQEQSLILIEEIENGLHPLALRRLIDYLIEGAKRKGIQVIFTTHSDYALASLPPEAVWACIDGRLQQGKLSIEVLRIFSGRIVQKLAIFVEDEFAKFWIESIIREGIRDKFEEIGIYPLGGDNIAIKTHLSHSINPALQFHSICFIDGDSNQKEDPKARIFKLPGETPEHTVFNSVASHLEKNIEMLTIACQISPARQKEVSAHIRSISRTNRDPHLLFSQLGVILGNVSETIIKGAFLSLWIQENPTLVDSVVAKVKEVLDLPQKISQKKGDINLKT